MTHLLNKIFRSNLPQIFSNDRVFINDLQNINKIFNQRIENPKSERDQHISILALFDKIQNETGIEINFYYMKKNDEIHWKDHQNQDVKKAYLFEYINKNIDKVFFT